MYTPYDTFYTMWLFLMYHFKGIKIQSSLQLLYLAFNHFYNPFNQHSIIFTAQAINIQSSLQSIHSTINHIFNLFNQHAVDWMTHVQPVHEKKKMISSFLKCIKCFKVKVNIIVHKFIYPAWPVYFSGS